MTTADTVVVDGCILKEWDAEAWMDGKRKGKWLCR